MMTEPFCGATLPKVMWEKSATLLQAKSLLSFIKNRVKLPRRIRYNTLNRRLIIRRTQQRLNRGIWKRRKRWMLRRRFLRMRVVLKHRLGVLTSLSVDSYLPQISLGTRYLRIGRYVSQTHFQP